MAVFKRSGVGGGYAYFTIDPSSKAAKFLLGKVNEAAAERVDQTIQAASSQIFVDQFNRLAPAYISATMFRQTGQFATPGSVQMYIARAGRRKSPSIIRLKGAQVPQAGVQETGRPKETGYPTISGAGRSFKIGGGPLYYVPLLSYFKRRPVPMEDIRSVGPYVIGRKVFYKHGQHFLLAFRAKGKGRAWSALRHSKGPKGKRRSRGTAVTKMMWEAMFAIYVGKTGIPGGTRSALAKNQRSPGQWYTRTIEAALKASGIIIAETMFSDRKVVAMSHKPGGLILSALQEAFNIPPSSLRWRE